MSTYYRTPKSKLPAWFTNFVSVADANQVPLSISAPEVATLQAKLASLNAAAAARDTAVNAAKGATQTLNDEIAETTALIAQWANQWQAGDVSEALIADLGLKVHDTTPSPRPVFVPANITVSPSATGTNWVRWQRNGNVQGIKFDVEVAYDGTNNWILVTTETGASFKHQGQTPGRETTYRVRARNGNNVSDWLTATAFYTGGPELMVA
ncbi:MAG: fibronectin type III domain-containing protein [Fimbriimonadaceae bacterium]